MRTINVTTPVVSVNKPTEHLIAWSIYFAYDLISRWLYGEDLINPLLIFTNLLFAVLTFYWFALYFYQKLLIRRDYWKALLSLFLFVVVYTISKGLFSTFGTESIFTLDYRFIISESWRIVYFGLLGYGFWTARLALLKQKEIGYIEKQLLLAKIESIQGHFAPHFLMGMLNNIFGSIQKLNRDSAKTITTLADVLRYSLLFKDKESTWDLEIKQLKKFIRLNQTISSHRQYIKWENKVKTKKILRSPLPGMTLITIVENLFKYGLINDKDDPARLTLYELKSHNPKTITLRFELINAVDRSVHAQSLGSGLSNLEKLLKLKYGRKALLKVQESGTRFRLILELAYEE